MVLDEYSVEKKVTNMNFDTMTDEEIREAGRERKIRNSHNKRIDRLKKEILEHDAEIGAWSAPDNSLPHLSWSQVLDCLDSYAMKHLSSSIEALDTLAKPYSSDFVSWLSEYVTMTRQGDVKVRTLYDSYRRRFSGMSQDYFERLLDCVCKVYVGRGWRVSEGLFTFGDATFPLDYHVQMWSTTKRMYNTTFASRVLSVLMSEEDER